MSGGRARWASARLAARSAPAARSKLALLGGLAALVVAGGPAAPARAHPLAPSLLELREEGGGRVLARLVAPRAVAGPPLRPVLAARCRALGPARVGVEGDRSVAEQALDCGARGLAGAELRVEGLAAARGQLVVRAVSRDGRAREVLLHGGRDGVVLEPGSDARTLAADYARLGAAHLAGGLDHLLFVAGLFALVRPARRLALAMSAFTVGHGLTLGAVALGAPAPPAGAVEAAIAASLVALAVEAIEARRGGAPGPFARRPFALALGCGLLHGLGFAGALREAGLPYASLPLAVGAFHAGVEVAQLGAWLVLAAAAAALRRAPPAAAPRRAFAWGLGAFGALLLVDRLAALLGTVLSS